MPRVLVMSRGPAAVLLTSAAAMARGSSGKVAAELASGALSPSPSAAHRAGGVGEEIHSAGFCVRGGGGGGGGAISTPLSSRHSRRHVASQRVELNCPPPCRGGASICSSSRVVECRRWSVAGTNATRAGLLRCGGSAPRLHGGDHHHGRRCCYRLLNLQARFQHSPGFMVGTTTTEARGDGVWLASALRALLTGRLSSKVPRGCHVARGGFSLNRRWAAMASGAPSRSEDAGATAAADEASGAAIAENSSPPLPPSSWEDDEEIDWQQVFEKQGEVMRLKPVEQARSLLAKAGSAVLITKSARFIDYPFGSKVRIAVDGNGHPLLAVSSLSPHTRDMLANPQCTIMVSANFDQLSAPTCTLMGDASEVVDEADRAAVRELYLQKHPDAMWVDFGDFRFIRIAPSAIRYTTNLANVAQGANVGEFTREEYEASSPDAITLVEAPIISHMNRDHADATRAMAELALGIPVKAARMLAMDRLGFDAEVNAGEFHGVQVRIPFPRPAESRRDIKDIIVDMTKEAMRAAAAKGHASASPSPAATASSPP